MLRSLQLGAPPVIDTITFDIKVSYEANTVDKALKIRRQLSRVLKTKIKEIHYLPFLLKEGLDFAYVKKATEKKR